MELKNARALVTGGTGGIGVAITRALSAAGAEVLIVGRDPRKLAALGSELPRVSGFEADLAEADDVDRLTRHVAAMTPALDILINNAGTMQYFALTGGDAAKRLASELELDLHAPIRLTTALLPLLLRRPAAAVVNVTTSLVYAPLGNAPGYSTAKGGLSAFTKSLRWQTRDSRLLVVELLPPTVDTGMTARYDGPKTTPDKVAKALLDGLASDSVEVRPGQAKALYALSRVAPGFLFKALNKAAESVPMDG